MNYSEKTFGKHVFAYADKNGNLTKLQLKIKEKLGYAVHYMHNEDAAIFAVNLFMRRKGNK